MAFCRCYDFASRTASPAAAFDTRGTPHSLFTLTTSTAICRPIQFEYLTSPLLENAQSMLAAITKFGLMSARAKLLS